MLLLQDRKVVIVFLLLLLMVLMDLRKPSIPDAKRNSLYSDAG